MIAVIILIVSLVSVIYGANFLVDGATSIAKKNGIPNIVIGLTIVAFGTSAPELAISLYSSINGNTDIAVGNVVGSNIANILLILGVTSIIFPLNILKNTVQKEIPFSLLAAIVLYLILNDSYFASGTDNVITMADGLILLSFMIIFMYYLVHLAKNSGETEELEIKDLTKLQSIGLIFGGLLLLVGGGKFFVDSASTIALRLGMSESVIGLTIVAIGTSLPELATSVVAALKKNADIAVGNIVGSNIFNIFFILGLSAIASPLPKGNISDFDLYFCIFASALLFIFSISIKKYQIVKLEGLIFLVLYIAFITYQIYNL